MSACFSCWGRNSHTHTTLNGLSHPLCALKKKSCFKIYCHPLTTICRQRPTWTIMKCYQMFFFVSKPFTFFQLASRERHGIVWCPYTTACFIGTRLFTRDRDNIVHPFLPFGDGARFDPRVRAPMVVTRIKFKFHGRISFVKKKINFGLVIRMFGSESGKRCGAPSPPYTADGLV